MSPWGLVNCKALDPQGSLLKNRMSELLTYGSVGGVGSNPGPYPEQTPYPKVLSSSGLTILLSGA